MASETQPIRSIKALTADTEAPQGRLFIANCTVAGNVTITLHDDTTHVIALTVGYSAFPYQVKKYASSGLTATATFANGI